MCWIQPQLIINLVRYHSSNTLTLLNLEGYEELNDLVLEFIAGVDDETTDTSIVNDENESKAEEGSKESTEGYKNRGLKQLNNLTLPTKSFVTPYGLKVLLENLPGLEVIKNAGRLGKTHFRKHILENTFSLKADLLDYVSYHLLF